MVELVEVLHVAEYDVLLVNDPCWNLLHPAGHLPKIRLQTARHKCCFLLSLHINNDDDSDALRSLFFPHHPSLVTLPG